MSQINARGIQNNQVSETKIRLGNTTYLRARNAADSADISLIRANASDKIEFPTVPQIVGTPSAAADVATVAYVGTQLGTFGKETLTLAGGDITNQYVDLAETIKANSLDVVFNGLVQGETSDYTVSLTGGAGGVTRVTFAGDLATGGASALIAGDILKVKYSY